MITQEEETDDWIYMFSTLKSALKKIFNFNYEPNILLADCAAEITNGFSEVYEMIKRVFCWAHVERAIETHLPGKGDKEESKRKIDRENILNDIRFFQKHTELENWIPIARLLINKWNEKGYSKEFIKYFQDQWLKPSKIGWIDHYADHVPCQTNGVESTNRYVKDNGTFRERLSIIDFLKVLETGFLYRWSRDRGKTLKRVIQDQEVEEENKKYVHFMTEPDIKTSDYTISYQWNILNKSFKKFKGFICVPAGKKTNLTTEECEEYFRERKEANWTSFDQAISHRLYYVSINEENWKLSKCSCYWWSKNYSCKHMIAVCFRSRLLQSYPDECKHVDFGCKRRRGRPKQNKSALVRLKNENCKSIEEEEVLSYTESECESEKEEQVKEKKSVAVNVKTLKKTQ